VTAPQDLLPGFVTSLKDGGWRVQVWVQPGAKRDGLAGEMDGRLKVRLAAAAVENKANEALLAYMARLLELPKSAVTLESGHGARRKMLRIRAGSDPAWSSMVAATMCCQPQQGDAGHG
jgi:hypothetical protein